MIGDFSEFAQTKFCKLIEIWDNIGYSQEQIIIKLKKVLKSHQVNLKLKLWCCSCLFRFFFSLKEMLEGINSSADESEKDEEVEKSVAVKDENQEAPSCLDREGRIRNSFEAFINDMPLHINDDFEFLISTIGFRETLVHQR